MMEGTKIAQRTRDQLTQLTGLRADTVSSLSRRDNGWQVTVEMVEMKRIPDSNDVLASYEVVVDDAGSILSYDRRRRYYRSQAFGQDA